MRPGERVPLEAGAAILAIAFLVKAGMWPLSFWLPGAYAAAAAPVVAIFAIMTKVGIYAVLRLSLLLFGAGAGESAGLGAQVLLYGGMATIAFGMLGVLAAQDMARMAGFAVLVSTGTLLAGGGAALGALAGHAAAGMSRGDLKELGEQLDAGTAGLVVVAVADMQAKVEKALARAQKVEARRLKADQEAIEKDVKEAESAV